MTDTELAEALSAAGCMDSQCRRIMEMFRSGNSKEAVKEIRSCRCSQLGVVHQEQRKVDLYDYLIGEIKERV